MSASVGPEKRDCVFCGIVADPSKATVVLEDESFLAFLDVHPVFLGHVLLVPRAHVPDLLALDAALCGPFLAHVQRIARAVEAGLGADGAFVATNVKVSQSVPHLHMHVVPRKKKDGLRGFFWPRQKYASDEERKAIGARIRARL